MAMYQDGCIEITTHESYLQLYHTTGDFFITLDYEEASDLLRRWSIHIKSRSNLYRTLRAKDFRLYDVKSVVKLLRQIFKERTKNSLLKT